MVRVDTVPSPEGPDAFTFEGVDELDDVDPFGSDSLLDPLAPLGPFGSLEDGRGGNGGAEGVESVEASPEAPDSLHSFELIVFDDGIAVIFELIGFVAVDILAFGRTALSLVLRSPICRRHLSCS